MKKFAELTQEEINKLSDAEFKIISPFEKKSCSDCIFLKSALNLWCVNEEAIKYRGTSIPGVIKCHFWQPNWSYIDSSYKTEENGYIIPKKPISEIYKILSFRKIVKLLSRILNDNT